MAATATAPARTPAIAMRTPKKNAPGTSSASSILRHRYATYSRALSDRCVTLEGGDAVEAIATLYLDAADLITLVDRRVEEDVLQRLYEAMTDKRCALVFTLNHAWDIEPETRLRLAHVLEAFPLVLMPDIEPEKFENTETDGLVLRQVDVRQLLEAPETDEALKIAHPVVTDAHKAEQAGIVAARATRDTPMRKSDIAMFTNEVVSLLTAHHAVSDEHVTRLWEKRHGSSASEEDRRQVVALAGSVAETMNTVRSVVGHIDPERLLAIIRDLPEPGLATTKPGTYMQRCLRDARRRDLGRNSKRSDFVDLRHVQYVPYVDIFTTDKENVAVLTPILAKLQRHARVLRNRCLERVIDEVKALA